MSRPLRLDLRAGYPPENVAETLRNMIYGAGRINTMDGETRAAKLRRAQHSYLNWHEEIELHVRSMSADPDLMAALTSERHWRIVTADDPEIGTRLILREVEDLLSRLKAIEVDFEARSDFAQRDPAATIVLPDTNVFLEFKQITDLKWTDLVGTAAVRLVVVDGVIDELDEWKYRRDKPEKAERARQALRLIDQRLADGGRVRSATTLDVLVDPSRPSRGRDADVGIREDALALKALSGRQVHIATGDHGMRDRARALDLAIVMLDQRNDARTIP